MQLLALGFQRIVREQTLRPRALSQAELVVTLHGTFRPGPVSVFNGQLSVAS